MKMRADPLLLAVALGLLNPSVFEVDSDLMGEGDPPPMLERAVESSGSQSLPLELAEER